MYVVSDFVLGGNRGCKWSNKLVGREIWQWKESFLCLRSPDNQESFPNHYQKITLSSQKAWKSQSPGVIDKILPSCLRVKNLKKALGLKTKLLPFLTLTWEMCPYVEKSLYCWKMEEFRWSLNLFGLQVIMWTGWQEHHQ